MVKNTTGGSKHKGMARKLVNAPVSNKIRFSEDEDECYAKVVKMLGNGMCHVNLLHKDVMHNNVVCHIRGKFRSRNKKANLSVVKKNLSKTHAKFFLPYAGFFQEAAKRDVYIKESNLKNSVNDYIEYLNEEVLDTTCYDEFLFNGANFISSQKIEREQSCISPENFYKEIFSNYSLKDSEIKEYFINSNFQDNLILYIELTDDDFSNTKLMFSVNFSKDKPEVKFDDFYWNKIKLENTSTTLNRKLHIKIRQDSFSWVIDNKMPWEDLSIGFQCKIDRSPDIYNVDFWDHFTNNYIG